MDWKICLRALLEVNGNENEISEEQKIIIDQSNSVFLQEEAWNIAREKYNEIWELFVYDFMKGKYFYYLNDNRKKFFKLREAYWEIFKEENLLKKYT